MDLLPFFVEIDCCCARLRDRFATGKFNFFEAVSDRRRRVESPICSARTTVSPVNLLLCSARSLRIFVRPCRLTTWSCASAALTCVVAGARAGRTSIGARPCKSRQVESAPCSTRTFCRAHDNTTDKKGGGRGERERVESP